MESLSNDGFVRSHILVFVGIVSECRVVCKGFVPEGYIKMLIFHPHCTDETMLSILSSRRDLRVINFTGSLYLTTPVFRDIYNTAVSVDRFILDNCNRIRLRPCSCVNTRMVFDRNGRNVLVSLRGCWYNFQEPLFTLSAIDTVEMVMCAMNSGTSHAICVLFEYFNRRVPLNVLSSSSLVKDLSFFKKWKILSVQYVLDRAGVLLNVKDFGLLVFHLQIQSKCWKVVEMFTTDIAEMWIRTSFYEHE